MLHMFVDRIAFPNKVGDDHVSGLMVMKSAAGYYIGRSYWDTECGFEGPYSRESGYYGTEDEAQADLDGDGFVVRNCIENNALYASGALRG